MQTVAGVVPVVLSAVLRLGNNQPEAIIENIRRVDSYPGPPTSVSETERFVCYVHSPPDLSSQDRSATSAMGEVFEDVQFREHTGGAAGSYRERGRAAAREEREGLVE